MIATGYRLTGLPPSDTARQEESDRFPSPGVYNDGVITFVDPSANTELLRDWRWLLPSTAQAIATTGLGDVFVLEEGKGISFLDVQRGEVEFVDESVGWFATEFLAKPQVVDDVLRAARVAELAVQLRPLAYLEVFVLEPWIRHGGEDKVEPHDPCLLKQIEDQQAGLIVEGIKQRIR